MNALKTFKSLDPKTRNILLRLFVIGLLFWTATSIFLPILPAYVADLGGSNQEVGFVIGSFAIGLIASRTYLGRLADERSRKIVLLIGTLVCGTAPLLYLMAKSIFLVMMIRAFHGISLAAFTTGYNALVVDISPIKQRGELIGYTSLCIPIGMSVGPALGSFLQEDLGYMAVFLTAAAFGTLAFILTLQLGENPLPKENVFDSNLKQSQGKLKLFANPSLIVPAFLLLMVGLVFGSLVTFLPLYVRELNIDFKTGLFYTTAAMSSFVIRIISGEASDRYGRGLFISGSLLCYSLAMVMIAEASSSANLLLGAALQGLGGGLIIPMILALLSDRCYPQERGRVFSFCTTGFDLGIAFAGPLFGLLSGTFSYQSLFMISAALALIALLIFISFSNPTVQSSLKFALGRAKDNYAL